MRFAALVVIGDKKGRIGYGMGKANEVPDAIKKATEQANKNVFRVQLVDNNRTIPHEIRAHVAGKIRMNYIRILPGDRVTVEISPYDLTRGRITYRHK